MIALERHNKRTLVYKRTLFLSAVPLYLCIYGSIPHMITYKEPTAIASIKYFQLPLAVGHLGSTQTQQQIETKPISKFPEGRYIYYMDPQLFYIYK
jgi:hypothetical protein